MSPDLAYHLAAGTSVFLIGLSKGGVGGMLGPLITATMALALPADQAVGILLPLLIAGDAFAVAAHWGHWVKIHVVRLVPASVIGVLIAVALVADINPLHLRRGLAVLIFLFVLYRLFEKRIVKGLAYQSKPWHGLLAGSVAGFTSGLAHVGGPPVSIYLLMQDLSPSNYAATSALFFALLNLIKLPFYGLAGLIDLTLLGRVVWLLPLLPLGVWLGKRFTQRVQSAIFEYVIVALLLLSMAFLLLGA
jgi:uncharacterized membrane protein YfcA